MGGRGCSYAVFGISRAREGRMLGLHAKQKRGILARCRIG
jgi:hypothetical protein